MVHVCSRASRGIGFEIVRQLLSSPTNVVVAAARTPEKASALKDLQKTAKGTLHVIKLDVSDFESIRASAKDLLAILGDNGLDYLINNAAVVRTISRQLIVLLPSCDRDLSIPRSPWRRKGS